MFITFEGIDASGKSSAITGLKKYLESKKNNINKFIFTREPGGKNLNVAEKIREIILDNKNDLDNMTEALLYLASRKVHIEKIIKPALKDNKIVICDRFIDSSIAYQGNARNLGMDKIERLNRLIIEDVMPDYTIYFRVDAQCALDRMMKENRTFDRLEKEGQDFFEKAIEAYDYLAKRDKDRYIVIDATQSKENVLSSLIKIFDKIIS